MSSVEKYQFISNFTVDLVRSQAQDADVVFAARVSTLGETTREKITEDASGSKGLIRFLMKERHGTPFEHNSFTFFVHAPIFVFREFMRHRIASYNEESGRYKQLSPVFYLPDSSRQLVQEGKPGRYFFTDGTPSQYETVVKNIRKCSQEAYNAYLSMINQGIAREVARMILPLNIYSSMYVTVNARSLMNFLSLRTMSPNSSYPSYPQYEIKIVAEQMEKFFAQLMPITHAAFDDFGRVSP